MSADIIPMPVPPEPATPSNITPLPSASPSPSKDQKQDQDTFSKLLKNPLVIAGGALLAGMALTRLMGTPSVQKLARDLADEALKRARQATTDKPSAPSLLEEAVESVRPQITEAARKFLADILKKPGA
jgi:hypothetical protein